MIEVNHQLAQKDYYLPSWQLSHMFLGTFNPEGGQTVSYYYGRDRNQFWPLLRELVGAEFKLGNLKDFLRELKQYGIACMDMINSVKIPEEIHKEVVGKGYRDSKIINGFTERQYNTSRINQIIQRNPDIKVYSTWGKGPALAEWKREIAKIEGIIPLVSPSMAAYVPKGEKKFEYMLQDWRSKINL